MQEEGRTRDRTLAAAIGLGAAFAIVTAAAASGWITGPDTRVIHALGAGRSPLLTFVLSSMSWLASGAGAIPAALVIAFVLGRRDGARTAWLYAAACLSGWALNLLLKELVHRTRPMGISPKLTDAGFYSFPSGHSMMAVLVFSFGAVLLARTVRRADVRRVVLGAAVVIPLLVGLARVYLGAHWPSDVLGAYLAGACWAATCVVLARRRRTEPA